eukprot:2091511-Rhodomonas_salina.2
MDVGSAVGGGCLLAVRLREALDALLRLHVCPGLRAHHHLRPAPLRHARAPSRQRLLLVLQKPVQPLLLPQCPMPACTAAHASAQASAVRRSAIQRNATQRKPRRGETQSMHHEPRRHLPQAEMKSRQCRSSLRASRGSTTLATAPPTLVHGSSNHVSLRSSGTQRTATRRPWLVRWESGCRLTAAKRRRCTGSLLVAPHVPTRGPAGRRTGALSGSCRPRTARSRGR